MTAAERAALLGVECGDDRDLRREVESLLTAQREAGAFLSRPASYALAPAVAGRRAVRLREELAAAAPADASALARPAISYSVLADILAEDEAGRAEAWAALDRERRR